MISQTSMPPSYRPGRHEDTGSSGVPVIAGASAIGSTSYRPDQKRSLAVPVRTSSQASYEAENQGCLPNCSRGTGWLRMTTHSNPFTTAVRCQR
jgi:hypothetical protein